MRWLVTSVLPCFLAAIIGGLVVLAGQAVQGHLSARGGASSLLPSPAASVWSLTPPVPVVVPERVGRVLAAFRTAGLEVGPVQEVTADSPCRTVGMGIQFVAGAPREGFCVFAFDRLEDRDAAWNMLSKVARPYPMRITVRNDVLIAYLGSSPDLAVRYEQILAGLR